MQRALSLVRRVEMVRTAPLVLPSHSPAFPFIFILAFSPSPSLPASQPDSQAREKTKKETDRRTATDITLSDVWPLPITSRSRLDPVPGTGRHGFWRAIILRAEQLELGLLIEGLN